MDNKFTSSHTYIGTVSSKLDYPKFCPECGKPLKIYNRTENLWAECPTTYKHFYKIVGRAIPRFDMRTGEALQSSFDFDNKSAWGHPNLGQITDKMPSFGQQMSETELGTQTLNENKRVKPDPPKNIWQWIKYKLLEFIDGPFES